MKKQDVINSVGGYINTDGIPYDLDGEGMSNYLKGLGFQIELNYNSGSHGVVITAEGISVSTSGYVSRLEETYIEVPVYSESKDGDGFYNIVGYRKEYVS